MIQFLHMKKNIFLSLAVVVLSIGAGFVLIRHQKTLEVQAQQKAAAVAQQQQQAQAIQPFDKTFSLVCASKKAMSVTFHLPDDVSLDMSLSDGRKMSLVKDKDQSNPRYFSADKTIVLSNTGKSLILTEGNKQTYKDCVVATH